MEEGSSSSGGGGGGGSGGSDSNTSGSGGAHQRELERMAEVLVTGEQLRLRLHEEKVIKDRRHHLKTYPNCFVAKELIDWLIEHKEASDRETAIKLMQKLADRGIIHHVCDEHKEFKDVKLFYRFRKDDGTFPLDNEVKAFMRGQRLYEKSQRLTCMNDLNRLRGLLPFHLAPSMGGTVMNSTAPSPLLNGHSGGQRALS